MHPIHSSARNQEHVYNTCHYNLGGTFVIVANDCFCCFIIPFSVLVLCQIGAGTNNMCDTFNIFVEKPANWSFSSLVNTIIPQISANSLFLCTTKETFSLPFQIYFPQPLPPLTFTVAFYFPYKLFM